VVVVRVARAPPRVIGKRVLAGPVVPVKTGQEATADHVVAEGQAIARLDLRVVGPTDLEPAKSGLGDQVLDGTSAVAESAASEGHDRRAVPRGQVLNGVTGPVIVKSGPSAIGPVGPGQVADRRGLAHNAHGPWGTVNNDPPANAPESAHRKPYAKVEVQMRHASSGATANATPAPNATWAEAQIAPASVAAKRKKMAWAMAASA
jgi:hypothetical protein